MNLKQTIIHASIPYIKLMRWHHLTGAFLLIWPGLWAINLASDSNGHYPVLISLMFVIGALFLRSASCIINDIIDRKIDAKMERTKTRPLASGQISVFSAVLLLITLLSITSLIVSSFNNRVIFLSAIILLPMVVYPYMNRLTYWPQIFLAFMGNWGVLIGWAAIRDQLDLPVFLLYAACAFWTLGYDTIYSLQDRHDNVKLGIKSSALKLGKHTIKYLYVFYISATILLWMTGIMMGLGIGYHIFLIIAMFQLLWQIVMLEPDNAADCMRKFESNAYYGALIFLGILFS